MIISKLGVRFNSAWKANPTPFNAATTSTATNSSQ